MKDLGALFFADASYGSVRARFINDGSLNHNLSKINKALNKLTKTVTISDSVKTRVRVYRTQNNTLNNSELKKQEQKAFKQFLSQLKQTLVDYGRTIRSISPDESVFLMVNISGADYLPNHVDLQISRSVLHAYGQGKISRQQAIGKVRVRKY